MAYTQIEEPFGLTAKTTPVDADVVIIGDSADATEVAKRTTWANIKATLKTYFDTIYPNGLGTATYIPFFSDTDTLTTDSHFTYDSVNDVLHTHKIAGDATDGLIVEASNGTDIGILGAANTANVVWYGSHNFDTATQDTIAGYTGAGKTLGSLATATYPSLTELSYVKGATSAVQTQLDAKLPLAGGTMTGNITLGENTSIDLDPAGSADGKYSGICITGTAGATLAFGDLIYLAVADSRWELTDADATATAGTPLIGMCVLAAAGDGSATKILLQGTIRADAKFPALTVGAPAYVGETAGAIQTAIPTGADNVIRVVGRALTADELYFCPSQDHQITVA